MRKLTGNDFKTVDYFGIQITVESDINYLATTSSGVVIAFEQEPELDPKCGWLSQWEDFTISVATVDLEGRDWKETLLEV